MTPQEERLRATLSHREKTMLKNLHTSICDIIWNRFDDDYVHIKSSSDLITYYHHLYDWLPILDQHQNYDRACDVAARIQFLDACGWNITDSFKHNQWVYSSPEDITVITTGVKYLATQSIYLDDQLISHHLEAAYREITSQLPAVTISETDFKTLVISLIGEHKHVQL